MSHDQLLITITAVNVVISIVNVWGIVRGIRNLRRYNRDMKREEQQEVQSTYNALVHATDVARTRMEEIERSQG